MCVGVWQGGGREGIYDFFFTNLIFEYVMHSCSKKEKKG